MTTPTSVRNAQSNFDTGPLSWVIGEIREALMRSKQALHEGVSQDKESQPTSLLQAKAFLHQAHGALQIVDIDGVTVITETVEDLLARFESGELELTPDASRTVADAYQALIEYLEELLGGALHQPVRLFPYYLALMEHKSEQKPHPSDLFFPNLSIKPQLPAAASAPVNYTSLRQRFEKALLPFLKSADKEAERASLTAMEKLIGEIETAQGNPQFRAFWWVMHGFAEAVERGAIRNEIYVKQLFARINLQIRRLSEGSAGIAERVLRDALFFIAGAQGELPHRAQQIRSVYRLQGTVPADYGQKRYAQINADALALAKEELAQAKSKWNRIVGGDVGAAPLFEQDMAKLADAGSQLNAPSLSKLLRELSGIARHAAHSNPGESLGLEVATSLLFVENALNHPSRLSEDFSEHADAMTARLLSIVVGEKPGAAGQWLDDMSREAQQRQTMTALAGEMQSSLAQVEKMLDEFFADPARRSSLGNIDATLHQIEGAMAILDHEDAARAIRHVRAEIKGFEEIKEGGRPEQQALERVAQNIGALSFFIETLQRPGSGARELYSFDEKLGIFRAITKQEDSAPEMPLIVDLQSEETSPAYLPLPVEQDVPSLPTVEDELAQHQQQSAELAQSFTQEPGNEALQEQLRQSLMRVRSDAALVEDKEANQRAQAAIQMLESPDFKPTDETLAGILSAAAPVTAPAGVAISSPVVPDSDEAIDAELLEIFLGEAQEVLECIHQTLPLLRSDARNQEHLTTLRRSFHTLKGSGRMVGLNAFGEAAWSIEQVLNLRLSDGKGGSPELYALIEKAEEVLGKWVNELIGSGRSDSRPDALVAAAARVKDGNEFTYQEPAVEAEEEAPHTAMGTAAAAALEAALALGELPDVGQTEPADILAYLSQEDALPVQPFTHEQQPESAGQPVEPAVDMTHAFMEASPLDEQLEATALEEFDAGEAGMPEEEPQPAYQKAEANSDNGNKRIGDIEISVPLHNIYLAETDELVSLLEKDFAEWRHEADRTVNIFAVHAAHSLAGSSATVGFDALHQVAYALEMVLQSLARKPVNLMAQEYDLLEQSVECLKSMLQKFALEELPEHEPEQVERLQKLRHELIARSGSNGDGSQAVLLPMDEPAGLDESVVLPLSDIESEYGDTADASVLEMPAWADEPAVELEFAVAEEAGFPEPSAIVSEISEISEISEMTLASLAPSLRTEQSAAANADDAVVIKDELDADLLPVFLEEGQDILPEREQLLRNWQKDPSDLSFTPMLLRQLHTIKGSARMAGAMELGQHMHVMETRIEQMMRQGAPTAESVDEMLGRLDLGLYMFDQLRNPDPKRPMPAFSFAVPGLDAPSVVSASSKLALSSQAANAPAVPQTAIRAVSLPENQAASQAQPAPAAPVAQVRVRADILDRLVNQAGEVSISRSKVETEVESLRQSLSELTENVSRLRSQLREIEIQAETQIASQMAQAADREFDPLEFDRFTRLQELTRSMAESVEDVASVQHNLMRTIDGAAVDLGAQARLTRDLQQDLMRVRMVQFASISERLYRVTRQASKEVDKRVHLDIRGGNVEIDRSVLERMAGPFEHLLRNSIVHGVESKEARLAAGKSEIGELLVEIRQEGNEVVMQFSDDGQGLNLNRIREKAVSTGLLAAGSEISNAELRDMIFHPGFSTAQEVTELAGRGIGMDVVRAEAAALGGRISIDSEPGKGAQFTIRLPLTLAVTQVVLVTTGGRIYAVPSVLVEQVQQMKSNPLTAAYNDGAVVWQGNRVRIHYLAALLGDAAASPVAQQYSPVIILKSGSERVAVHVDEVIGNREVVVKNIGPQLSRMLGIAGATVLGSGDIVLILNPVQLAHRELQETIRAPRIALSSADMDAPGEVSEVGAVAELHERAPSVAGTQPVQGLRTQHIVMVVDDSLTVRRVTQRFLTREGYQVVLAKDGVDALEQLQAITPDVMLVDIEMPRMDGFDLTRNVRSDERTRHIPIIMITSRTAAKHRNYAMELGVNEYLGKPYQESELLGHISAFVNKAVPAA